jgi:hypothetical protein
VGISLSCVLLLTFVVNGFFGRRRPPKNLLSLVRQNKFQRVEKGYHLIVVSNFPLKGSKGGQFVFDASLGFKHEDGLHATAHHRIVGAKNLLESFLEGCHGGVS